MRCMRQALFCLVVTLIPVSLFAQEESTPSLIERLQSRIRDAMHNANEDTRQPLRKLQDATSRVDTLLGRIDRHVESTTTFLRQIGPCPEIGSPAAQEALSPDEAVQRELIAAGDEMERAFDELGKARDELHASVQAQTSPRDIRGPDSARSAVEKVLDSAEELLTRRRDASASARWLKRIAEQRRSVKSHDDLCRFLETAFPLPDLPTLTELRRDPLLPVRREHERVQREFTKRQNALERGDWSIGVGVIWTPLEVQRYGVVSDPDHAGQLVIAKTGEEMRAGQPVLMASFRPLPEDHPLPVKVPIRPYVEFGTGLQFDEPSFYVGGALDLGPYLHVGVGYTAQQVEVLADGQHALDFDDDGDDGDHPTVVAGADAIRLDEEFDGDIYVSFTLRLDRLSRLIRGE